MKLLICRLLALFALTIGAGPVTAQSLAPSLQQALDSLSAQARPAQFGIEVLDLQTGASAQVNAARAYPMMSMFKAPVAAAVLDLVASGTLRLDQTLRLSPAEVINGSAVPSLGARLAHGPLTVTVDQLLTASVSESDNTAVDVLIRLAGGPSAITAYLRRNGIDGMRVDTDEHGLSRRFEDLQPGQSAPAGETDAQKAARQRRGYGAFLASKENTTTTAAAISFLHKLHDGQLLPAPATRKLLGLMTHQRLPNRIRAGLPQNFSYAYKTGTGTRVDGRVAAWNDMGIVTAPDGHALLVAAFLIDTPLDAQACDQLHAELGKAIGQAMAR